jgi:hypothetical protein
MLAVIVLAGIAIALDHRSRHWPKPGTEGTVLSTDEPVVETGGYGTASDDTEEE